MSRLAPNKRASWQSLRFPDTCPALIAFLTHRICKAIDGPYTFEQLRTLDSLKMLIAEWKHCNERFLIFALLWCRLQFFTKSEDAHSLDGSRGHACEIAAMRLLRRYNNKELLQVLTSDYHALDSPDEEIAEAAAALVEVDPGPSRVSQSRPSLKPTAKSRATERSPLRVDVSESYAARRRKQIDLESEPTGQEKVGARTFTAMEVAIVAEAKHFIASQIVQDVLTQIWNGEIVFWSDISQHEYKKAQYYDPDERDFWDFARLRVPKYQFCLEWINFVILAGFYLAVVVDREYRSLGWLEILLGIFFIGFAYQEYDQFRESGDTSFYLANPWNYFDLGIIAVSLGWIYLRAVGVAQGDMDMVARSYDVLSLQGILLVPRLFSFLSLTPYFGTLFPCLRKLAVDFTRFLVLIIALFAGFLITFAVLGRNTYTISQISWLLVRIFFGNSYLAFDSMRTIDPIFGPPLMVVFVVLTQILITTVLISILSNSFAQVMSNSREEYLFLFATTCLESAKSDHMVILSPPFNLIPLFFIRPLRICFASGHPSLTQAKIVILKLTHAPYVLFVSLYERSWFRPQPTDAWRRRTAKSASTSTSFHEQLVRRASTHTAANRIKVGLGANIGLMAGIGAAKAASEDGSTDEEEGLDTGIMLDPPKVASEMANEVTRARLERMEKDIAELKSMLKVALAKRD